MALVSFKGRILESSFPHTKFWSKHNSLFLHGLHQRFATAQNRRAKWILTEARVTPVSQYSWVMTDVKLGASPWCWCVTWRPPLPLPKAGSCKLCKKEMQLSINYITQRTDLRCTKKQISTQGKAVTMMWSIKSLSWELERETILE